MIRCGALLLSAFFLLTGCANPESNPSIFSKPLSKWTLEEISDLRSKIESGEFALGNDEPAPGHRFRQELTDELFNVEERHIKLLLLGIHLGNSTCIDYFTKDILELEKLGNLPILLRSKHEKVYNALTTCYGHISRKRDFLDMIVFAYKKGGFPMSKMLLEGGVGREEFYKNEEYRIYYDLLEIKATGDGPPVVNGPPTLRP